MSGLMLPRVDRFTGSTGLVAHWLMVGETRCGFTVWSFNISSLLSLTV